MGSAARYRRRFAQEQDAASVYRALAARRQGEDREILLALARAEERHAAHWSAKLHLAEPAPSRPGARARLLGWLTRRLGSLVVLGLVQRAEAGGHYDAEPDATAAMAADERVHALVVAGLAQRQRARVSGWFRAAVFGANDGLVSNFSLVLGVAGAGHRQDVEHHIRRREHSAGATGEALVECGEVTVPVAVDDQFAVEHGARR